MLLHKVRRVIELEGVFDTLVGKYTEKDYKIYKNAKMIFIGINLKGNSIFGNFNYTEVFKYSIESAINIQKENRPPICEIIKNYIGQKIDFLNQLIHGPQIKTY